MTNLVREGFNQPDVREDVSLGSDRGQRALRMPHCSAWIASRWDDPAFPDAFPWFNSVRYWGEQILALREQLAVLEEPPLELE
jgi:Ser/Thr protein kinase RdoA (MazF antagonist)